VLTLACEFTFTRVLGLVPRNFWGLAEGDNDLSQHNKFDYNVLGWLFYHSFWSWASGALDRCLGAQDKVPQSTWKSSNSSPQLANMIQLLEAMQIIFRWLLILLYLLDLCHTTVNSEGFIFVSGNLPHRRILPHHIFC